jgi:hypothetical protein
LIPGPQHRKGAGDVGNIEIDQLRRNARADLAIAITPIAVISTETG